MHTHAMDEMHLVVLCRIKEGGDVEAWAADLRRGEEPVVARVARDALIVDPRTLLPGDVERLIGLLNGVISAE